MDFFNHFDNQNQDNARPPLSAAGSVNGFAVASLSLGILSIVTCCVGVTSLPMGALGILFALLSRKKERSFSTMALVGIVTSAFGMAIGTTLIFLSLKILYDASFRTTYVDPLYLEMYGMTFEEFLQKYVNQLY